jgi:hypothetical protein
MERAWICYGAGDDWLGIWHGLVWNDLHGRFLDCFHYCDHISNQMVSLNSRGPQAPLRGFGLGDLKEKVCQG